MMTDDQILEVVSAHKEGKKIEYKWKHENGWQYYSGTYPWDFASFDYRVVLEPRKPREWTVRVVNDQIQATGHTMAYKLVQETIRVREVIE